MRASVGYILSLMALSASLALGGCQESSVLADRQPKVVVPEGTQIVIRLEQRISTSKNTSGETYQAVLAKPIEVDNKVLAPVGSEVIGELTQVEESGRIKGRARLTMTLKSLALGGEKYTLDTRPLTIEAAGSEKKDAQVIAGTAALGAIIGAIAGGGKGAAIGAGAGAGAGTGAVLYMKGSEVKFDPECRFAFRLASPLELPAYSR